MPDTLHLCQEFFSQINPNLPDKRDYLILYTRFIFLVTVKAGCENVFFVPDPLGDHWYVSEHNYE